MLIADAERGLDLVGGRHGEGLELLQFPPGEFPLSGPLKPGQDGQAPLFAHDMANAVAAGEDEQPQLPLTPGAASNSSTDARSQSASVICLLCASGHSKDD